MTDLKDHPTNPRTLSQKAHAELLKSFDEFDYVELVAINLDGTILAGHQRVHIMFELGWQNQEIEVRVPSKQLSEKQAKKYLLRSNKNTGDWDYDILANDFEVDELYECGFEDKDFQIGDWKTPEEEEEDVEGKEYDESITDDLSLMVRFNIQIPTEDATSFHNQLDELLKKFPRAKMEKKV